jgi:crotonobetainyl-CoA:carnitine CoA-transferase CaiB-like acyl-CoA transferase
MPLPLKGVRVVEVATVIAGPYAGLLLRDLGAEVVHVEGPSGDVVRSVGPSLHPGMATNHLVVNRGKRSVTLDLSTEAGRCQLKQLTDTADVFLHNLRPETVSRLGADSERLRSGHQALVHCGIRGYGSEGPDANLPAYDDVIQARSGIAALQEKMTGQPQFVANALADKTAGLMAAMAITSALYNRERSGIGCAIEVPMLETVTSFTLLEQLWGSLFVPALTEAGYPRQTSPDRRPYKTANGWIAVLLYTDRHWSAFCEIVGCPELLSDERFATVTARNHNLDLLLPFVEERFPSHTTDEWIELLTPKGIPCARYNRLAEVFKDPHLKQADFFETYVHPTEGHLRYFVTPLRFDGERPDVGSPAPFLGEHNDEYWGDTDCGEVTNRLA